MAVRRDGRVWLADSASLQLRAANGAVLREVPHAAGEVRHMIEHADGSLWLAAQAGLFRLAPGAPAPQPVRTAEGEVLRQQTFMLAVRADGNVWVGSVGGLFLAAADGSSVRPVRFVEGAGLANPIVIGLLIDRSGRLWLDTAVTGLHREVRRVGELIQLDTVSLRHGTAGHPFGANLLEDGRGRIWTHMSMYDPGADRLVALSAADGAALGTGWFGAFTATSDGSAALRQQPRHPRGGCARLRAARGTAATGRGRVAHQRRAADGRPAAARPCAGLARPLHHRPGRARLRGRAAHTLPLQAGRLRCAMERRQY
jgi:ligand-binding sensor domain-containing protein